MKIVVQELVTFFMYHFLPFENFYMDDFLSETHGNDSLGPSPLHGFKNKDKSDLF